MLGLQDIFDLLKNVGKKHKLEDMTDRINAVITVFGLLLTGCLLSAKQAFGQPIQCYAPAETTGAWLSYYHDFCFIQNKIIVQDRLSEHTFLKHSADPHHVRLVYYQWVPYIVVIQAFLFMIPRYCWEIMADSFCYGTEIESIVHDVGLIMGKVGKDNKEIEQLAKQIDKSLTLRSNHSLTGYSITTCYVIRKWLTLFIVGVQFFFLAWLIPHDFDLEWALKAIGVIGKRWTSPMEDIDAVQGFFPTIVRCDVERIEPMKNTNTVGMQCVLMMNFINEKVFIIMYFYFVALFCLNFYSAVNYTILLLSSDSRRTMADYLFPPYQELFKTEQSISEIEKDFSSHTKKEYYKRFVNKYLSCDGIFLFMFVFHGYGGLATHELYTALWNLCFKNVYGYDHENNCEHDERDEDETFNSSPSLVSLLHAPKALDT